MRQRPGQEWLDADQGAPDAVRASLADLAWIHRRLGGASAMRRLLAAWLARARQSGNLPPRLRILDAGAGAGAGTAELLAWLRDQGYGAQLIALDRRPSHLAAGRPWPAAVELLAADLFAAPLPARSFDLVMASLLLHHFHGPAAVDLLRRLAALSRGAVLIHDLERGWLGYAGFSLIAAVRLSRLTRHDGRVSFRQAYTAPELAALTRQAGFADFQVRSAGPFRLGLTFWPEGESNDR
ncbi:MAG: methyltransferase domain-containing protein [Terriglobales bacterium]